MTSIEMSTIIQVETGNATHSALSRADAHEIFVDWMHAPGQGDIHWVLLLPLGLGHRFYPNPKYICTNAACPCKCTIPGFITQ